jgi:hypothetical protein
MSVSRCAGNTHHFADNKEVYVPATYSSVAATSASATIVSLEGATQFSTTHLCNFGPLKGLIYEYRQGLRQYDLGGKRVGADVGR